MNCRLAQDLLQQNLDGAPIESPEWLTHLRQCAECRSLASASRRLQDGLRLLAAPVPPPGLADRIAVCLLQDRRSSQRRLRQRWAIGAALAAGLLFAMTLGVNWRSLPTSSDVSPSEQVAKNVPDGIRQAIPTLNESAAELGEVFTDWSNETVGQTRRWVSSVPSPNLPIPDLKSMVPSALLLREAGEGLSEGLEPVTTSARRAVHLFLRDLPLETESSGL